MISRRLAQPRAAVVGFCAAILVFAISDIGNSHAVAAGLFRHTDRRRNACGPVERRNDARWVGEGPAPRGLCATGWSA